MRKQLKGWRRGRDLNSRTPCEVSGFQDRHVRPLRHPSIPCLPRPGVLMITLGDRIKYLQFLFSLDPFHASHIGPKGFRNHDRSIRLLIVFQDGDKGSSYGKPGSIQRMDKLCLRIFLPGPFIANPCPPGLKRFKVAAGGDFSIRGSVKEARLQGRRSWLQRIPCRQYRAP